MSVFDVIYADPPWSYRQKAGARGAEARYACLEPHELSQLDVEALASPDSTLWMWATCPMLQDALDLGHEWGFEYVTVGLLWVKTTRGGGYAWGMGHWTRANAEACLLFKRGAPRRWSHSVHQIIAAPRGAHSAKPAEARDRIVQLMGDVPRVELFARQRSPGWEVWGNEVASTVEIQRRTA